MKFDRGVRTPRLCPYGGDKQGSVGCVGLNECRGARTNDDLNVVDTVLFITVLTVFSGLVPWQESLLLEPQDLPVTNLDPHLCIQEHLLEVRVLKM